MEATVDEPTYELTRAGYTVKHAGTMLSVDWDFFYYPDPASQGHTFFEGTVNRGQDIAGLGLAWVARVLLQPSLHLWRPRPEAVTLWTDLRKRSVLVTPDATWSVSDSHTDAWSQGVYRERVISLDTHHDLGYGEATIEALRLRRFVIPTCENWLGCLAATGTHVQVVYPPGAWEWEERSYPKGVRRRFATWERWRPKPVQVQHVHLARSSGWTPPWGDQAFNRLAWPQKLPPRRWNRVPMLALLRQFKAPLEEVRASWATGQNYYEALTAVLDVVKPAMDTVRAVVR